MSYCHDFVNISFNIIHTGCAVTPCKALSQASCLSPDYQRGTGLLPEEVEGHVSITTCICDRTLAEAPVAMAVAKCQEVGALPRDFSSRRFERLLQCVEES